MGPKWAVEKFIFSEKLSFLSSFKLPRVMKAGLLKRPIFTFDVPFRKWDSKWKKNYINFDILVQWPKSTKNYYCFLNTYTIRLIWNFGRWVMQSSTSFRYWDYFVYSFGLRAQTSNSPKSVVFTHANKYTWVLINIRNNACDFDLFCWVIYFFKSFYCGVSRYSRQNIVFGCA